MKTTNQSAKAIHDSMTQKRRELLTKSAINEEDDVDSASDDDNVVKNGDKKTTAFNVDVLLSEEKNPWIGESSNDNEMEMKERMAKLLKDAEEKSKKVSAGRADVNPTDFGFVKEKRLLNVGNDEMNSDGEEGDEDEASGDEEKRQQVSSKINVHFCVKLRPHNIK